MPGRSRDQSSCPERGSDALDLLERTVSSRLKLPPGCVLHARFLWGGMFWWCCLWVISAPVSNPIKGTSSANWTLALPLLWSVTGSLLGMGRCLIPIISESHSTHRFVKCSFCFYEAADSLSRNPADIRLMLFVHFLIGKTWGALEALIEVLKDCVWKKNVWGTVQIRRRKDIFQIAGPGCVLRPLKRTSTSKVGDTMETQDHVISPITRGGTCAVYKQTRN